MWRLPRDMMLSDGVSTLSWPRASCMPLFPPRLRSLSSSKKRLSLKLFCLRRDRRRKARRRSSAPLAFFSWASVLLKKQIQESFNASQAIYVAIYCASLLMHTFLNTIFKVVFPLIFSSPVLVGCRLHQDALGPVVKSNAVATEVPSIHAGMRTGEATGLGGRPGRERLVGAGDVCAGGSQRALTDRLVDVLDRLEHALAVASAHNRTQER